MIASFPKKPICNPSGLQSFEFIPVEMVSTLPNIVDGVAIAAMSLVYGGVFYTGYATPETLGFAENQQETEQGIYYEQLLSGTTPGDKPELTVLMEMMVNRAFYVLAKDIKGVKRLIGLDKNFRFKSDYSSGVTRTELKGYKFTFSGLSLKRAPVYPY